LSVGARTHDLFPDPDLDPIGVQVIPDLEAVYLKGDFFSFFSFYVRYSTLLYLPPLRFHCVGGCLDRTQGSCDSGIGCQTL
jgi:hypothetical protein